MAISLRQRRATRYRFLPPCTRNAFFHTDCSWLENRATGLKNPGWEPLTSRKCPPILVRRSLLTAMSFFSGMRTRNALCDEENFVPYILCVCAVCYRFFMSHVTGIKACDSAHASTESAVRLYAFRNGLIVFSLFRAYVKACSSFNLSRVKLVNEIIECNPSFFFDLRGSN